jgi:hypothetical protein
VAGDAELPPTREEVGDDVLEQLHVVDQELGQVGVAHGADEHHVLAQVGIGALERARHHQHRLDGAHAKVVVVLRGKRSHGR